MITLFIHCVSLLAAPFIVFERLTPRYRWHFRLAIVAFITLVLAIVMASGIAVGVPENVRHGYPSCAACHVAGPVGGGAVTPYGRSAGAEVMPTWSYRGEEEALFGLAEAPDWLSYGGDARYITTSGSRHVGFWMQRDLEIAVQLVKGFTVGGSGGVYGPLSTPEWRKSYAKVTIGHLAVRAGRFVAGYGLAVADHRLPTRAGLALGQGAETYNGEATVSSRLGEITMTSIQGSSAGASGSAADGYRLYPTGRTGWAVRAALFPGDSTQLGASVLRASDMHAAGLHIVTGSTWWFLLAEWDRRFPGGDLAIARAGLEPARGLQLGPTNQWDGTRAAWGAFATWFPRPHLELSATTQYVIERYESAFLFHFFL